MSKKRLLYEVALWEFNRWFKIKDQIISIVIMSFISLLVFGGKALLDSQKHQKIHIAVIHYELLPSDIKLKENLEFKQESEENQKMLFESLAQDKLDGILIVKGKSSADLHVNEPSAWINEIKQILNVSLQSEKLKEMNLSNEQFAELFRDYNLKITSLNSGSKQTGIAEKVTAGVFIVIMLVAIFISLAYQLSAITGEKQLRITELVVSAISPQTWIDGKILGISLLSSVSLISYSLSAVFFVLISALFGSGWSIPLLITNPALVSLLLFLSVLGFFFWNIFFTAIAATINDPNTSARGSLMFIPFLPVIIAFFAISNPGSPFIKFMSVFPVTSPPVMSVRLVMTNVTAIEIISSIILLFISMWFMRILAAKIFSTSILMSGKEPEWKEIMKWLKQS